ncbi:MAG TPA: LysR family transcriptional regulator [Steroidobacteraceae bacterium]
MIDTRRIRSFVVLAETLHFGRAAARLHVTQPPLSRMIAALESELGVKLLERGPRRVSLTRAGERFHADGKAILASIDRACKNARAAARGRPGELFVGFTSCAAFNVIPAYVRSYGSAFPGVDLKIREMLADDLMSSLVEGKIDAAIMFPPDQEIKMEMRTIYTEPLCVAMPTKHRLAGTSRVHITDLADERLVIPSRSGAPTLYDDIVGACRAGGFEPHALFETSLLQTILNLVAENVGVALVPRSMSRARLRGVCYRPLVKAPTVSQLLLWNGGNRNPCLQGLLRLPQPK